MRNKLVQIFSSLITTLCLLTNAYSQDKFKLSGFVKDSASKEPLIGAIIQIKGSTTGVYCDANGFYAISLSKGQYNIEISFLGYSKKLIPLYIEKDTRQDFTLQTSAQNLSEVSVVAGKIDNVKNTELGTQTITMKEADRLPKLLGETDPIKAIQLLPGVQSSGEGNAGFHVRGGSMDQNLILIDNVPLYNAGHLFGFFSIFNANAIEDVSINKAAMPANYGGRLASVLDVNTKNGDLQKNHLSGGIGLLSSNLTIEGPIAKDNSSFIVSARRTYIDAFKGLINKGSRYYQNYNFFDINAKLYFKLTKKDRLYLTFYKGRDAFEYDDARNGQFSNDISWGTQLASLKWNHLFNDKFNMSLITSISEYQMDFKAGLFVYNLNLGTRINDVSNKLQFINIINKQHTFKYGLENIYHIMSPQDVSLSNENKDLNIEQKCVLHSNEAAAYVDDEYIISKKISIKAGFRFSLYQQLGPFSRYNINDLGQNLDTISYSKNKIIQTYKYLEPRFALRYLINESSSIKLGYTQNYQYIHLAPVSSISLPTDIWIPSSSFVKPQYGRQYAVGYFRDFAKSNFETSIEAYYKTIENVIEYKEGILSVQKFKDNYDQHFFIGKGESFGAEFFIKKTKGKLTGWLSYTLSKTTRSFDEIEGGRYFYAKHDRRHDMSINCSYKIGKKWMASAVFIYATGNAVTIPVSRYLIQGRVINTYSQRNAYRMPAYHRMDVSLTYTQKKTEHWESEWNFSIYNVYNRRNPLYVMFATTFEADKYLLSVNIKQVSIFSILPSLSWRFKF